MKITHKKIIRGPGGIKCQCCTVGSAKVARTMLNRRFRRISKQTLSISL